MSFQLEIPLLFSRTLPLFNFSQFRAGIENFETLPRVSKTEKTLKTFVPRVCKMRKTRDDGKINEGILGNVQSVKIPKFQKREKCH